jgi:hypothetical protein
MIGRDGPPDDPGDYDEYIRRVARAAVVGEGNVVHGVNGTGRIIVNALALLGVGLITGAIGFAFGELFNHEHRISGLEAIEQYKDHGGH